MNDADTRFDLAVTVVAWALVGVFSLVIGIGLVFMLSQVFAT